jgi:hypothetical protein
MGPTSYLVIDFKNIKLLSSGMLASFSAIDVYYHFIGLEDFICPDDRSNSFL